MKRYIAFFGTLIVSIICLDYTNGSIGNSEVIADIFQVTNTTDSIITSGCLRWAIEESKDGDTIYVASGNYILNNTLQIFKNLTIIGEGGPPKYKSWY